MNVHKGVKISNRQGSECIYCRQKATDKDHVINRGLFPNKGKRLSLIVVPACNQCNVDISGDEEFFRMFMSGLSLGWSKKANEVFNSQVARQLKRKPSLGWQQFNKMKLVEIKTPSGIDTGKKVTEHHVTDEDWNRCHRVVEKTVKGLVYTLLGERIDKRYEIRTTLGFNDTIKNFLPWLEYFEPSDYEGIFSFGYAMTDAPIVSVWFTQYFDRFTFCTWINKEGGFPMKKPNEEKNRVLNLLTKEGLE